MDLDKLRSFIEKQSWVFAKTYANKAPHEYIVRGRINGIDEESMVIYGGSELYSRVWNHDALLRSS